MSLFSAVLNYDSSKLFCRSLLGTDSGLTKREAFAIGATPPLTSQIFIVAILLSSGFSDKFLSYLLLLSLILAPSLAQNMLIKFFTKRLIKVSATSAELDIPFPLETAIILIVLFLFSLLSTYLKFSMANHAANYSNLAFLGINMLATSAMVFSKSSFLSGSRKMLMSRPVQRIRVYLTALLLCVIFLSCQVSGAFGSIPFIGALLLLLSVSVALQAVLANSRFLAFE
jgi:hypothetical protein